MGWSNNSIHEHHCKFPYDKEDYPVGGIPGTYWTCDDCGAEWKASTTGWTGWWFPCYETGEVIPGKLYDTVKCTVEEWTDCPPGVQFDLVQAGSYGNTLKSSGGYRIVHPNPGPRPNFRFSKGDRRPIVREDEDEDVSGRWIR